MNLLALLTTGLTLTATPAPAAPADSVGVEVRGGQRFVKHRVAKGETLYALARRYNVRPAQIQAANPRLGVLLPGQLVLVPRGGAKTTAVATAPAAPPAPAAAASGPPAAPPAPTREAGPAPARHTVAKGETVFSIARRFNLTSAGLIRLNGLPPSGSVREGQELLLTEAGVAAVTAAALATAAPAATPAEASRPTPVKNAEPVAARSPAAPAKEPAPAAPTGPAKEPAPAREEPLATVTPAAAAPDRPAEPRDDSDKAPTRASEVIGRVTESGLAALIERSGTDKYLALHKTAPVGMIMQVKNAMNGQSVYVRVIGKLPDTGENSNILVRLSPRAVQKLGTPDQRFRVETSYVP